jgi:hypothetical protein
METQPGEGAYAPERKTRNGLRAGERQAIFVSPIKAGRKAAWRTLTD